MSTQLQMMPGEVAMKRAADREALRAVIQQWNADRLDLFELSEPNEDLLFHGVMRFYFHDASGSVTTKCIRVASDATVTAVIETLIEKFRPDMRMLSVPEYALYVTHENGDERRLNAEEKPLLVQLNWAKDDREGRFLLKRIGDDTAMPAHTFQESSFRRKLSKREKKQLKKQEKLKRVQSTEGDDPGKVAEKLYTEMPETSFTRSISNPEAVMRRRRHQKLERKLQQFRSKDGGPDTGGTLKIYGEALCGDVPYKTLLLSIKDTAASVIREMLGKYGKENVDEAGNYVLVQTNSADGSETILDEDECPLSILMHHPATSVRKGIIIGSIMFHVRRRPADYHPRKRKKKPQQRFDYRYEDSLPFFLELNPDGSEIMSGTPKRHVLHPNVTEVGSERTGGPHLQLFGPNIQPRHCVIAHTDGLVTVTPCSRDAEVFVNSQRIFETSILQNGAVVKFGRIHNFRFIDPAADEMGRPRPQELAFDRHRLQIQSEKNSEWPSSYESVLSKDDTASTGTGTGGPNGTSNASNYETTFDVDGNVETVSLKDMDARSQRSIASSRDGNRNSSNYDRYPRGSDPILPAVLEVREETEDAFLNAVILDLDHAQLSFKLAPTYVLYLTARYRASTHFRPELLPTERAHRLTAMLARVAQLIQHTVEERYTDPASLAFWMANAAELLHFLKCDRHISAFSLDAQDILADSVQAAFRHLVACMQCELAAGMAHFLSEREEDDTVLGILCNAMALLRLCRVNAALTIQLFSHLFHFINMLAFNKIVSSPSHPQGINYCTRAWGVRLKARVAQLAAWAERQGLELAASCHLGRLAEAAFLLEAPKYNVTDLAQVSSTCLKLNSIQLRALLRGYQPGPSEPRLSLELIDNVVRVAENVADELARSDGREVKLEESPELQLAFLLPEDGFSCDVVRGLHPGLGDFVHSLQVAGLCRMTIQPTSSGVWTIYMADPNMHLRSPSSMSNRLPGGQPPPEFQTIRLHKTNNGMGLSIVAAKGAGQDRLGIYIKSVVAGGAADADGRLQAGDQLLKVDGHSLVGITQEKAAEYLVRTGPIVTLEVAKQGAIYHGLATLLSQPSPLMARANASKSRSGGVSGSASMGSLQNRLSAPPAPGLAKGYPPYAFSPLSPTPYPSFNGLPAPVIPNIVILDVDADTDSGSCHDSDDPAKSAIFTQIRRVEFPQDTIKQHDRPLTKEEADQCMAELHAIVADFERATVNATTCDEIKREPSIKFADDNYFAEKKLVKSPSLDSEQDSFNDVQEPLSLDLSGVVSDSESTVAASEDSHHHTRLIKKYHCHSHSLDHVSSVKDLTKQFEYCSHPTLSLFDPRNVGNITKAQPKKLNKKALQEEDAKWSREGKVSTLAKYFSSIGDAGITPFGHSPHCVSEPSLTILPPDLHAQIQAMAFGGPSHTRTSSEPSVATLNVETQTSGRRFAESVETQTSARGRSEVHVQTAAPDYDYRLIYSLLKDEKKKKFPKDYIRRRKPKWQSLDTAINKSDNLSQSSVAKSVNDLSACSSRVSEKPSPRKNVTVMGCNVKSIKSNVLTENATRVSVNEPLNISAPSDDSSSNANSHKLPAALPYVASINLLRSEDGHSKFLAAKNTSSFKIGLANANVQQCPSNCSSEVSIHSHANKAMGPIKRDLNLNSSNIPPSLCKNPLTLMTVLKPVKAESSCFAGTKSNVRGDVVRVYHVTRSCDDVTLNPVKELLPRCRSGVVLSSPRRMSERDLPSRLGEEKRPLPAQMPIHSSKSVPSLHTAGGGEQRPQEMFNPGYSRTSSSNSIPHVPHAPQTPIAYRSNQNLSESRNHPSLAPGLYPAQSTPSLPQSHHAMYNSTPNSSGYQPSPAGHHGYPSVPGSASNSYNQPRYSHNEAQGSPHGSYNTSQHDGPMASSQSPGGEGERFYQNLAVYPHGKAPSTNDLYLKGSEALSRERERPASAYLPHYQHQQTPPQPGMQARSQSSRDMLRQEAKIQEMSEEVRRREMRGQNPAIRGPLVLMSGRSPGPGARGPGHLSPEGYRPNGPVPDAYHDSRHPAVPEGYKDPRMGQIAPPEGYRPHHPDARTHQMGGEGYRDARTGPHDAYRDARMGPPISPMEGREPARVPDEYRDSPPPPPPPVTTHPLMQKAPTSPDNRYQASSGEAPRGGYYPANPADKSRQYPYTGTNPWDREEKEKEQARRREAVRQWRDQQIGELSAVASRTPQQEEQLRALKLEREFERRAEEAKQEDEDDGEGDGEEETESSERVQGLLKMAQAQNGPIIRPATGSIAQMKLEDVRNRHAAGHNLSHKPTTPTKPSMATSRDPNQLRMDQLSLNGPMLQQNQPNQQPQHYSQYNGYEKHNGGPAPPERGSSYNTMQQLSPAQERSYQHDRSYQSQDRSHPAINQSLDRSVNQSYQSQYNPDRSFNQSQTSYSANNQSQTSYSANNQSQTSYNANNQMNYSANNISQSNYNNQSQDRSYNMSQSQERSYHSNQSQAPMSPTRPNQLSTKRVSFSNTPPQPTNQKLSPQSPQMERIAEDPNNFINEAETMLQSPTEPDTSNLSTGNTPGVIGAQEVYRDPRQRMLAEQKQNLAPRFPGPEKLSFKEKMKMFAMETGEDSTPRDKVKISRAQRDIDNINSPGNNNNNSMSVNNN